MVKNKGFTLIELIIFVIVLGIVSVTILNTMAVALRGTPIAHNQTIATTTATKCMDYFLGQYYLKGYDDPSLSTSPGTPVQQTFCPVPNPPNPNSFSTSVKITNAQIGGVSAYKLITVTTNKTGQTSGPETATLKLLIAKY
jgi:prepilin-type N-terminal cleavage/methylation domain-containing protein